MPAAFERCDCWSTGVTNSAAPAPKVVSRLHHLLMELVPGGTKMDLPAQQARALLNTFRPRDMVGKARRWLASKLIHELVVIDKKIKIAKQELTELVLSTGSRLMVLHGIGPSGSKPCAH